MGILDDLKNVGGDVVDLVHDGTDVVGDVVKFEVNAAGDVVDAAGKVLSATVDATGQVLDAGGTVVGRAGEYVASHFADLGPLGPSLFAAKSLSGLVSQLKSQQLAGLAGGQPNADVILDLATDCEMLFKIWRPRMLAAGHSAPTTWDEAARMFDRERGMSFATLRADQAHLSEAAAKLQEAVSQQEHETRTLASTWQGDGGAAAQTYLRTLTTRGASTAAAVATLAQTYGTCATELETAVKDKAHALSPLYQESIDGKSPEDVDRIIAASRGGGPDLDFLKLVGHGLGFGFFGGDIVGDLLEKLRAEVQRAAQQWLDQVFAPTYIQAAASFLSICDSTTASIIAIYDALAAAKAEFDPAVFTPLNGDVAGPAPRDAAGPAPRDAAGPAQTGDMNTPAGGGGPASGGVTAGGPTSGPVPSPSASPATVNPPAAGAPGGPDGSPTTPTSAPPTSAASRPAGLPGDAVWVSDANQLPQGWTVDPTTGEVLPPGAPGGAGDIPIHSPAGQKLFDDDGVGDLGGNANAPATPVLPAGADNSGLATAGPVAADPDATAGAGHAAGSSSPVAGADGSTLTRTPDGVTASSITVSEHGVQMQISAQDAGGHGALVTVTDAAGHPAQYRIEIGAGGAPVLAPVSEVVAGSAGPQGSDAISSAPDVAGSPVPPTVVEPTRVPADGGSASAAAAHPALTGVDASSPALVADGGAAAPAPAAAAVHTAAWQHGWGDDGSTGAQLAGTPAGPSSGGPAGSSAALAGSDPSVVPHHADDGFRAGSPVGGGGPGLSAGVGAEVVSRTGHWHVTDEDFAADSASWANLSQVLGHVGSDRQTGAGQ